MSTRATYHFKPGENDWQHCETWVYIHYDGYPTGAAVYFHNALLAEPRGNFATRFIRANELAEITCGHHGDTDYHYEIKGSGPDADISMRKRVLNHSSGFAWSRQFDCKLREFLDNNSRDIACYQPFKFVKHGPRKSWLNLALARKAIENPLSHLEIWSKSPYGAGRDSGNWKSCENELDDLIEAFPELGFEFNLRIDPIKRPWAHRKNEVSND